LGEEYIAAICNYSATLIFRREGGFCPFPTAAAAAATTAGAAARIAVFVVIVVPGERIAA